MVGSSTYPTGPANATLRMRYEPCPLGMCAWQLGLVGAGWSGASTHAGGRHGFGALWRGDRTSGIQRRRASGCPAYSYVADSFIPYGRLSLMQRQLARVRAWAQIRLTRTRPPLRTTSRFSGGTYAGCGKELARIRQ